MRETGHLYAREGLVRPGTVLRMCNLALLRNVLLGLVELDVPVLRGASRQVAETLVH